VDIEGDVVWCVAELTAGSSDYGGKEFRTCANSFVCCGCAVVLCQLNTDQIKM
jgi:hypothetical protein